MRKVTSRNLGMGRADPRYEATYKDLVHFGGHRAAALAATRGRCSRCGDAAALVHHRDGDKTNHAPDNLAALCRSCHAEHHTRQRELDRPRAERRSRTEHARSFITPEIAHRRSATREQRRREKAGRPATLHLICDACGAPFDRPNIYRYRRITNCSHRCALLTAWKTRRQAPSCTA